MYIIQLTYNVPIAILEQHLQAHRDFLEKYYKQGLLIMSGPMNPRTGGIIIAAHMEKEKLNQIIEEDPFYISKIAAYTIQQFIPIKHCAELTELIQKTEPSI